MQKACAVLAYLLIDEGEEGRLVITDKFNRRRNYSYFLNTLSSDGWRTRMFHLDMKCKETSSEDEQCSGGLELQTEQ
jgi:hypothetical protein